MPDELWAQAALIAGFLIVGFLYSSVGHGGASGYLALLSLAGLLTPAARTGALVLNCLVAGTAWLSYWRARHLEWRLVAPFAIASIPAAFVGALIQIESGVYHALLAATLCFAAVRLLLPDPKPDRPTRAPSLLVALPVGGFIGLLSGVVGVGGGIFLSPLMLLLGWADARRTAAASAAFIVLNSLAGLAGRFDGGSLSARLYLPLAAAAFAGGIAGSWLGARRLKVAWLRRILGAVLAIAAVKLVIEWV